MYITTSINTSNLATNAALQAASGDLNTRINNISATGFQTSANFITGVFNLSSSRLRYVWTGQNTVTGFLPNPVTSSGVELLVFNKGLSGVTIYVSGNIDSSANSIQAIGGFTAGKFWSDSTTWLAY